MFQALSYVQSEVVSYATTPPSGPKRYPDNLTYKSLWNLPSDFTFSNSMLLWHLPQFPAKEACFSFLLWLKWRSCTSLLCCLANYTTLVETSASFNFYDGTFSKTLYIHRHHFLLKWNCRKGLLIFHKYTYGRDEKNKPLWSMTFQKTSPGPKIRK